MSIDFNWLIEELKMNKHKVIYLSHEPWQEQGARKFANRLRHVGFKVIVAADVRPHKDRPHGEEDLKVVEKTIEQSDIIVVYQE